MDRPTMRRPNTVPTLLLTVLVVSCLGIVILGQVTVQLHASAEFPVRVVDGFGRNVTIARDPERIVSLSPSNTEILFAIDAGSKLVGVTRYCDYPPEVLARVGDGSLKVVGGFKDPNTEIIASLQPDLILASSDLQMAVISSLEAKGFTVFALAPTTIEEIVENVRLVGRIVGRSEVSGKLADSMTMRIDAILNKTRRVADTPRVYYEVWYDPLMSVGQGTYLDDLIRMAGGANIFSASTAPYPVVNPETVIAADPQIIIISKGYMGEIDEARSRIRDRPGWSSISAIRNNRICAIEEDTVYRHGPRIVDGLETLALVIHSESFPESGLHSLLISTSPSTSGVEFQVDGSYERTDNSGTISLLLKEGTHTVKLMNSSILIGPNNMMFLGWTGAASGKNGLLSIYLDKDLALTANYYYTKTSVPSGSLLQFNHGMVLIAAVCIVTAVLLAVRLRPRHSEVA